MTGLIVKDLGRCDYETALQLQQELVETVQADSSQAFLVLVEHDPPVITLGKDADAQNVLASGNELEAAGVELHETSRGGDVTYHGPGQIVGYPILDLKTLDRDVHAHIRRLEGAVMETVRRFGIEGVRREGLTGVWTDSGKIAAIGVAVRRWVTYHGFALNVCPDLSHFELIVPCGIAGESVVSMAKLLSRPIGTDEVKPTVIECFRKVMGAEQ